jgi:2-polyprenyl-6-methoxyphenol hydroxylase-like FAD-dependent oxidoreductase
VRGTWRADGTEATVRARLVIGADGKHSLVARETGAPAYHEGPVSSAACYTYWSGVELGGGKLGGGEVYARDGRAIGAWPTNDGLVMTYVAWPVAEFDELSAGGRVLRAAPDPAAGSASLCAARSRTVSAARPDNGTARPGTGRAARSELAQISQRCFWTRGSLAHRRPRPQVCPA